MSLNETDSWFLGGVGLWIVAMLVAFPLGVLNALLNPFLWVSSMMEGVEGVLYLASGGSMGAILSSYGATTEATQILMGWIGLVAWLGTIIAYRSARDEDESILRYLLVVVPLPILPVTLAIYRRT